MKVLLFSRYGRLGASSRVRSYQYLSYFQSKGIEVSVKPLFSDAYLEALYSGRSRWREVAKGYLARLRTMLAARNYDVVYIEKELFPFLPAFAERALKVMGVPYVVDYDDALFHRYDCHSNVWVRRLLGKKIDKVMRHASTVIAGNRYLAERAFKAGTPRVEIIPTVLDVSRYHIRGHIDDSEPLVIGWIGSPSTSRYLEPLLPTFNSIGNEFGVRFVAIGARESDFADTVVEVWPWSEQTEVESIQMFDIGIMPLPDTPWEHGKCGYKLIQYMACGIPVIASPVGVNRDIVSPGQNGYLADSLDDWDKYLRDLIKMAASKRMKMGEYGRCLVEDQYTLEVQADNLVGAIESAL